MILGLIESKNSVIVIAALQTLSKILRSSEMQGSWSNFLELIVLKYIDNYKTSKEVCPCVHLSYKTLFIHLLNTSGSTWNWFDDTTIGTRATT